MTLRGLIDAVETGNADFDWGFAASPSRKALPEHWHDAMNAYLGSLDAAKRLHDALLPGWRWGAGAGDKMQFAAVLEPEKPLSATINAESDNPARAWLLAILRALEGEP